MKTTIASLCCSCLLGVAALAVAQDHADKKDMMMKDVKVTGCVAAGTEADHFMLEKAMMADKKDGAPMSYALMGGTLKPHVGHKVEVTGTLDDKKPTMAADKPAAAGPMLKVKSVKMISPTCE
jgi:hypothetical protein